MRSKLGKAHADAEEPLTVEKQDSTGTFLGSCRALDLTDREDLFCGRVLADLGADVIKVESPGGDPSRNIAPFYQDSCELENSLHWLVYNLNKRGITLDIESADGRVIFKRLTETADLVIESFPPGYMDKLGLGYSELSKVNPRIIVTSITPFGQEGPYNDYKSSDIVNMAMGGLMYPTGTPDRPPLRVTVPQSYTIAGINAAMATMVAHYYREMTGEGQHVDVSVQASVASVLCNFVPIWELNKINVSRLGSFLTGRATGTRQRTLWRCKDGYVILAIFGGALGRKTNQGMVEWMDSEQMAPDYMKQIDWGTLDFASVTQELQDSLEKPIGEFVLKHTKAELFAEAIKRGIMLFPVCSPKDIVENEQLQSRGFWLEVEHPEKDARIKYPGFFIKASETPCQLRDRAPLLGEHNSEVYVGELGLSTQELVRLKENKVI
ncbi:CaiB/BaiF CoA transferase family protein [Chloroflexota bacterium]